MLVDPPFAEAYENQPRQELTPMFIRSGAIYLVRRSVLLGGSLKGPRCVAQVMPRSRSVNIDSPFDLELAAWLMTRPDWQTWQCSGPRALLLEPEDNYGAVTLERLRATGIEVVLEDCRSREQLGATLATAARQGSPFAALFVRLGLAIDGALLAGSPGLKWVVTPTTGLDHIDVQAAERLGIRVLSLKGRTEFLRTVTSTAELTMALLLALVRRLPAAHADVLAGGWRRAPFAGQQLRGLTLGVVGLGRLGSQVAVYARAFEMSVLACDERDAAFNDGPFDLSFVQRRRLDALLAGSDVVSLHLPLEPRNRHILDAGHIARMRPGALLVNTARGELVDEGALLDALRLGALGGAALDVLEGDSRWEGRSPPAHPLLEYARGADNLVLTPHIGGYSRDAIVATRAHMAGVFCQEIGQASPGKTT